MYQNLLFDWSGTLVDDLPPTLYATNAVLAQYDVAPMGREEFRRRFRLPYPEFYDEVLPGVPIGDLEDTFRSAFHDSPEKVTVLPHAREILNWCSENGIRTFLLSSMDVGLFTQQAEEFELLHHFEKIYAGVIDKRKQIGPLLADHALEKTDTAFVGDMVHDIATAHFGEVDSVALATGYDPVARLEKANPTHLFDDLEKFRAILG